MSTYDIEAILSQDDWLRRMARSLVQDPHAANDLAQDAWLADLQGGDAARDRRSWLSVVLHRAGSKRFRTERVQRERAEASAYLRDSEAPATDEIVGDSQLRSLVAEELLALPEPERTAVHLVYVAGLSVTEAGRRMGVAKSTASKRVYSGLEKLRAKLDSAYGGDRRSWCAALLPWASVGPAARKAPAVASASTLPAVVAALAVSALALGWAWQTRARPATPETAQPQLERVTAAVSGSALTQPTAEAARAPVTIPTAQAASERTARISARFVNAGGSSVPGTTWSLSGSRRPKHTASGVIAPEDLALEDDVIWTDLSGQLDANGNLDVTFEVPLNYLFQLTVAAPGHASMRWAFRGIARGDDKQLGTLQLEPGFTLLGRIVSPSGEPLDQQIWSVTGIATAGNGLLERVATRVTAVVLEEQSTFQLTGLPAGEVSLDFTSMGQRTSVPQTVNVSADNTEPLTFAVDLSQTASSSGLRFSVDARIGDLDPKILPADFIATASDGRALEVVARGSSGSSFEALDASPAPISLSLNDPRFEPWSAEFAGTEGARSVRLLGSASLELNVRDAEGHALEVYEVALAKALKPGEFSSYEQPLHDGKGALPDGVIEHVVPGSHRLIVRATSGESVTLLSDLQPGERRVVDVTLLPNDRGRGRVTYPDGAPAAGVVVYLVRPALVEDSDASVMMLGGGAGYGGDEWRMSVTETRTLGTGEFELELPDAGSYYVMAHRPHRPWVLSELRSVEALREPVDLVLPRGATLAGSIDLPQHLPQRGWAVFIGASDPRMGGSERWRAPELDVDGSFRVEGVPAGEIVVALTRERISSPSTTGTPPAQSFVIGTVSLTEGQVHEETFSFIHGAPAAVTAELPQGEGLDGTVSVSFYRADGGPRSRRGRLKGSASDLGSCLLAPGPHVAGVVHGNTAVLNGPVFSVSEAPAHTVPLGVSVTERRIRVFGDGIPLANQSVEFRSPQGPRARFKTDADGWLTVRLDAGPLKARWRMTQAELTWPPAEDELRLENPLGD